MQIKTKTLEKIKPKPVCGQSGNKVVQPIRCTTSGELMVCQTNQPDPVSDGVNRRNKDGVLILGDDGSSLRNIRISSDGTIIVKQDRPIDIILEKITVDGKVSVENTVAVEPVTVTNMPTEMRVQENLHVIQVPPVATRVAPFSFAGRSCVILSKPCRVYSVYFTVYEPTFVEVVDITGEMHTGEFNFSLFPQFIQVDKVEVRAREYTEIGGYILYENC